MEYELYHYGVKGMKWGVRKRYDPVGGMRRRSPGSYQNANTTRVTRQQSRKAGQAQPDTPEAQAQKRAARIEKAKKAAKIGAVVAGTALAAYGTYKLAKFVQQKRSTAALQKAQDYVNNNMLQQKGHTVYSDGTHTMSFASKNGQYRVNTIGTRNHVGKDAGRHNAQVMARGRQMYKDATDTRFDRGLAKVVNAGDAVGNAGKKVGNAAKSAGKKAGMAFKNTANKTKNAVLDVVNPIYEYTPGATTTTSWRDSAGMDWTRQTTEYHKIKKKRK